MCKNQSPPQGRFFHWYSLNDNICINDKPFIKTRPLGVLDILKFVDEIRWFNFGEKHGKVCGCI